jgi:hypothetical protein
MAQREADGSAAAVVDVSPLWGSRRGVRPSPDVREPPGSTTYDAEQLDVLALLCTAVKVLYVSGSLARAASLAAVVEPLRRASRTPLHETLVRNEVAYFGCARQVRVAPPPNPDPCVNGREQVHAGLWVISCAAGLGQQ